MLNKIVSLVSDNRGVRSGEKDGVDYVFVPKESIQNSLHNGELLQHIQIKDVEYGYAKKDFDGADELIVVCGGSGAGKDKALNTIAEMKHPLFAKKDSRFLFSIPKTIPLFANYAKDNNIPITIIFLDATENERLRRVVAGNILSDENLMLRYGFNVETLYDEVSVNENMEVSISSLPNYTVEIVQLIESAKKRVERDNTPQPFNEGIASLKSLGYDIRTIDVTEASLSETIYLLLDGIEKGRRGQYAEGEEEELSYSVRQESLQELLMEKAIHSIYRRPSKREEVENLISSECLLSYLDDDTDAMHYMLFGEGDVVNIVTQIMKKRRDAIITLIKDKYEIERGKL